ncbi:MAG TPA: DUF58 domain-containing protein [Bryobacteraceae bacterium]|jgi:uncharacterized protein (DUF58 family)
MRNGPSLDREPLLDRKFLERLERLTIHWQRSFAGLVGGHNTSRFAGGGQEFLDHRNFHHGDDLRAVNWRAYLRLEKMFLKMFQIEPRVPVHMLLDSSASMISGDGSKFDVARKIAASLCYIGLVRLDTIALQPFSRDLGEGIVGGGGRHRFRPVMEYLQRMEAKGVTNFDLVVREFIHSTPHRGLVIMLSDFLDDGDCLRPLQYIADYGHELLLIQIFSEEDRTPPWNGELELVDAETQAEVQLQFDEQAREQYTRAFDEYSGALQQLAMRNGGRFASVSTATSLEDIIFGALVRTRGIA